MDDKLWNRFVMSGSVADYLSYKSGKNINEESQTYADKDQGTCNQGTDDRRER